MMRSNPTKYDKANYTVLASHGHGPDHYWTVDTETCELKYPIDAAYPPDSLTVGTALYNETISLKKQLDDIKKEYSKESLDKLKDYSENNDKGKSAGENKWIRLRYALFSLEVPTSLLSGFSVQTFYTTIVLMISSVLRPVFIWSAWEGWIYDITHPEPVIKLVEACYIGRHEEDLVLEEEVYRMIIEIFRSPELFKSICGSNLRGECDPNLDDLKDEQKQKLKQLDKLAKKGFDVKVLKDKVLKGYEVNKDLIGS